MAVVKYFCIRNRLNHKLLWTPAGEWSDLGLDAAIMGEAQSKRIKLPENGEVFEVTFGNIEEGSFLYSTVEIPTRKGRT